MKVVTKLFVFRIRSCEIRGRKISRGKQKLLFTNYNQRVNFVIFTHREKCFTEHCSEVVCLGKSHNSSWLRYLCQTRPPLPPQAFLKKVFAKAREFYFFTFFQLVSSFVMLISVVGHSTFAFAPTLSTGVELLPFQ